MKIRILAGLSLLFSVLFLPFWVSVVLALTYIAYFSFFLEAPILFLMSDLLYGAELEQYHGFVLVSFTLALIFLIGIESLKRKLKFYP